MVRLPPEADPPLAEKSTSKSASFRALQCAVRLYPVQRCLEQKLDEFGKRLES